MSVRSGRRIGLVTGLWIAAAGALVVIGASVLEAVPLVLLGTFGVGVASAVGLQARYAASDLALPAHVGRDLSMVVWATTVGAVLGPNLMQPSADLADAIGLPPLSGPYLVTASSITLAALLVAGMLRPDPLLAARDLARASEPEDYLEPRQQGMVAELAHGARVVRSAPGATLAVAAIAVGHVVMVMVMVMTPVHMQHVDVTLQVVGLVISVHILGMYAFSPVVGWLADRRGSVAVISGGSGGARALDIDRRNGARATPSCSSGSASSCSVWDGRRPWWVARRCCRRRYRRRPVRPPRGSATRS